MSNTFLQAEFQDIASQLNLPAKLEMLKELDEEYKSQAALHRFSCCQNLNRTLQSYELIRGNVHHSHAIKFV